MYNNQSLAIVIDIHRLKSTLGANICKLAFPNFHEQPLEYHIEIEITIMVIKAIQLINIYAHSQQQVGTIGQPFKDETSDHVKSAKISSKKK